MDLWASLLKSVGWVTNKAFRYVADGMARRKAGDRAIQGGSFATEISLVHLVEVELERLSKSDRLTPGVQSDEFRAWLRHGNNIDHFLVALIGRASGSRELSRRAEDALAEDFELVTGETRKLALGPIDLAVSYVVSQLESTKSGKTALQTAVELWNAGEIYRLRHSHEVMPNTADKVRLKSMASALIEAGKRSWKMPQFVAPLVLEAHEKSEDRKVHPISVSELSSALGAGQSLVIFGAGGIGKTTFLLELGDLCMREERRIPLYVDAAAWGRYGQDLFEFLAMRPSARLNGVSSAELTKFANTGGIVLMLNGWNEIPVEAKSLCRDSLTELLSTTALSVVVVSRTSTDTPRLTAARYVEVRGLTWKGQSAVIRAELTDNEATALLDLLAKDRQLRHAARSPLILRGLLAQAKAGTPSDSNAYDLLGAAVQAFEEDDQRDLMLASAPVYGHQRAYAEEIACVLTERMTTNCSRQEALQAINCAAKALERQGIIGALPEPVEILDVMSDHHLLHLDGDIVRFVHQRFQEYFAGTRILRACFDGVSFPGLLPPAINQPAWDDSLVLAAGKLKGGRSALARAGLVREAAAIDLGAACDLAGVSEFAEADDPQLHAYLVSHIREMIGSPLDRVRDLGICYEIASALPAFANHLWSLLEDDRRESRLNVYRLNGSGISLRQLGDDAPSRVAKWLPERRAEFVREIGDNADNYEFLVAAAKSEADASVRVAAICELFWSFPTSDAPIRAWLDAPTYIQTEQQIVSLLSDALDYGIDNPFVRERLCTIPIDEIPENSRLHLAVTFPSEIGARSLDLIFDRLRGSERRGNDDPLIAIARVHAPDRLSELAQARALEARVPDWVLEYLRGAPSTMKSAVVERGWQILLGPEFHNADAILLGTLSNSNQVERSVMWWLQRETSSAKIDERERDRQRHVSDLIMHSNGSDLLKTILKLAPTASYNESAELVGLILHRIERSDPTQSSWQPTVPEVQELIRRFADKLEVADVPQEAIRVYLSCIASDVAPGDFGQFLLETCRRELDAWTIYHEKINAWSKNPTSPRPQNPYFGLYLISALAKWGLNALPGLLELLRHPSAMHFVPDAIARVAVVPWTLQKDTLFSRLSTDIEEGARRRSLGRELRQPADTLQSWTDQAAKSLGQRLDDLVSEFHTKKANEPKWNRREAEHVVGRLTGFVVNIPSPDVVAPVSRALASGLMEVYGVVGALRGLVRQGAFVSEELIWQQLEALYQEAASAKWHDDSSKYAMSEFCQLLFLLAPSISLDSRMPHYLIEWRRFSYPTEIIRRLGETHSDAAWKGLLEMGRESARTEPAPEELAYALVSCLTSNRLGEFFELVADRTFLAWCRSEWTAKRLAPQIAAVLGQTTAPLQSFVGACSRAQSTLADALAIMVLSSSRGAEGLLEGYLIECIDAGRATTSQTSAYQLLNATFTVEMRIDNSLFEVSPKANNSLRAKIYERAKGHGSISDGCRNLLASLESARRENGRPIDEPRHPAVEDGSAWTDAFILNHS